MPTFTIYVTGGGEYFYTTLNAVAMIFNDGSLIYTVIALGGMLALISGSWNIIQKNIGSGLIKSHTFIEHGLIMVVVAFLAFVPTRVTVQDIYGQQNATPIDNVPMLLSVPATMFSSIGYDAFRYIDTAFQSVAGSTMTVSENGFVTPLKLMMAVRGSLERVSPELYRSWVNFIGSCTRNSTVTTGGVLHSPDVARYLTTNAVDGGLVEIFLGRDAGGKVTALQNGQMVTCTEAKPMLNDGMSSLFDGGGSTNPMSAVSRNVNMNMSESNRVNPNGQWDWTSIENAYNSFAAAVGSSAQSAQEFTKNALIRNAVVDGFRCGGNTLTATDQLLCTQAMNDAVQQYSIDAAGQGSWFSRMMLPTMTILQLLFFAFSVMAFLYGILRGAGVVTYLGKYMLFGAWVFSWLPFVAIINAFINWMVVDKMKSSAVQGLTVENYDSYFMTMQDNLALASDLLAATPLITMALMTGSMYALSGVAQRMSSTDKIEEKNLAPSTADVGPVVRYGHEFDGDARTGLQTSATTLDTINVSDSLSTMRDSAMSRAQTSQLQTMESFSQMVRARQEEGGSTRITNTDGTTVEATESEMYKRGMNYVRGLRTNSDYSTTDIGKAEAALEAALKVPGLGGASLSAAIQHAINSADSKGVQDILGRSVDAMAAFSESSGRALASNILSDTSNSNSKAYEAASGYDETASKSETLGNTFRQIDALSNSLGSGVTTDVAQLSAVLSNDIAKGTNGHGWQAEIERRSAELAKSEGPAFNAFVQRKEAEWRESGATFANMGHMAQLMALRQFGDHEGFATLVSEMKVTSDLSGVNPDRYSDVAPNAQYVNPNRSMDHHDNRVTAAQPGAEYGHATWRSRDDMKADMQADTSIPKTAKTNVMGEIKDHVANTADGVMTGLSAEGARHAQMSMDAAQRNIYDPPKTEDDYNKRMIDWHKDRLVAGGDIPQPLPPQEVIDERVREAQNARYLHPSEVGGMTPQEQELLSRQRAADAVQAVHDEIAALRADNERYLSSSALPQHTPNSPTIDYGNPVGAYPGTAAPSTQRSADPVDPDRNAGGPAKVDGPDTEPRR